jgi:uncharacterized membrane protein (DUF4010 family)
MESTALNVALLRLLVAALLGGFVGIEREQRALSEEHMFAGIRTFPLFALLGATLSLVSGGVGAVVIAGFGGLTALVVVSYFRSSAQGHLGTTTETAALTTYWIGVIAGAGELALAGSIGVAVAILLAAKERLEEFPRAVTRDEMRAALVFAVLAVIILPILPNRPYGPWGVWNPQRLWMLVVLVCGLSFAAWVAMRVWGSRLGFALSGVLGGLVSSTVVTVSFATHSREAPEESRRLAVGSGLASLVMLVRIAILALVVNAAVLVQLAPILGLMLAGGALGVLLVARREPVEGDAAPRLANPFDLRQAIRFTVLYAAVLVAVEAARRFLGPAAVYTASAVAGLTDVDAITLSLSSLAKERLTETAAAAGIAVGAIANTIAKAGYAMWLGSPGYRRGILSILAFALAGATTGIALVMSGAL